MTISSPTRIAGPFTGAGTTATFPFAFKVFAVSDLYVLKLDVSTGTLTALTLTADYTVALNGDQDATPGGSITLTAGNLPTGKTLTLTSDLAALQGVNLMNGGGFYPDTINVALDTLTILVQQALLQLGRALQVPLSDTASMLLPVASQRAGRALMFDASGNLSLVPVAAGGVVPGAQNATGTVDGSNLDFQFTAAAGATPSVLVFVDGIFQTPSLDYGTPTYVSGTTWQIAFTTAPTQGPITVLMLA